MDDEGALLYFYRVLQRQTTNAGSDRMRTRFDADLRTQIKREYGAHTVRYPVSPWILMEM